MSHHLHKHLLTAAALTFAIAGGTTAIAGELPSYERASLPATPVQLSVLGSAGVQQQSPAVTLTRDGVPATPLQLSVLAPHHHRSAAAGATTTVGAARN
jgi:hypothetical protein